MWLYYVIIAVIFFATFAMCIDKGLWSNTITAINILFSGLIAFACYQPAAKMATESLGEYTYLLDFLMLWTIYVVAFVVLHRVVGGMLSTTRMRFKNPIDTIGGPVSAAVAGWLMTGLVAASLHAAPFDRDAFGGVFTDGARSSPLTNPDLAWLSICEKMLSNDHLGGGAREFSINTYVNSFNKQREALEKEESLKVRR